MFCRVHLNRPTTRNFSDLQNKPTTLKGYGITDALLASTYTSADVLTKIKTVDGAGSGLEADTLDGLHKDAYMRYEGWVNNPGYNANTMAGNTTGFTYANNAPYVGPIVNIEAGGYNLEINSQYNNDRLNSL